MKRERNFSDDAKTHKRSRVRLIGGKAICRDPLDNGGPNTTQIGARPSVRLRLSPTQQIPGISGIRGQAEAGVKRDNIVLDSDNDDLTSLPESDTGSDVGPLPASPAITRETRESSKGNERRRGRVAQERSSRNDTSKMHQKAPRRRLRKHSPPSKTGPSGQTTSPQAELGQSTSESIDAPDEAQNASQQLQRVLSQVVELRTQLQARDSQLSEANRSSIAAGQHIAKLEGNALKSQDEKDALIAQLRKVREDRDANRKLAYNLQRRLKRSGKGKLRPLPSGEATLSLDPFHDTIDEVSEAHVKNGGEVSLEGVNESVHILVHDTLEAAECLMSATRAVDLLPFDTAWYSSRGHHPLLAALAKEEFYGLGHQLSSAQRGLILDALLHHEITEALYVNFFDSKVCPVSNGLGGDIEDLYRNIRDHEPWSVSQRWRAVTVAHFLVQEDALETVIERIQDNTLQHLAYAYRKPPSAFESISDDLRSGLTSLCQDAFRLSEMLKTRILKFEVFVTGNLGRSDRLESCHAEELWPQHRKKAETFLSRPADKIIGTYSLGLAKRNEQGDLSYLTLPQVITEALLGWVGMDYGRAQQ